MLPFFSEQCELFGFGVSSKCFELLLKICLAFAETIAEERACGVVTLYASTDALLILAGVAILAAVQTSVVCAHFDAFNATTLFPLSAVLVEIEDLA